jgi:O-antigen/teichoic acid export membrane protein
MLSKAKYLAAASAFEYALQFALPILLTRTLAADEFATYRFLWLVASTVTGVLLLGLPQSLFYFLPRRDAAGRVTVLWQTIALCTLLGAAAALLSLLAARMPWSADAFALLPRNHLAFLLFLTLFCGTAAYDTMAAAMSEIAVQARISAAASTTRVIAVLAGVWIGTIEAIVWALVVYVVMRFALQTLFVVRRLPVAQTHIGWASVREQVAYSLPFGLATGFWQLRGQAEQWVGATMLAAREYASLSIAASIVPVVLLVRRAITNAIFADLNRLESEGKHVEMVVVNGQANVMAAAWLFPLLAMLFAVAQPLVVLVYTGTYADAAFVTQLLIIGSIGSNFIETSSMAKALNLGRQLLMFDAAMLVVSVALSIAGGWLFGLQGIVIGSIVGRYMSTIFCAWIVMRRLRIPLARFQPWERLVKALAASVIAAALGLWVVNHAALSVGPVAQIAAGVTAAGLAYVLLALAMKLPLRPR